MRPARILDAHVHLWDPARTDWYPYLGGGRDLGMGDVSGMARRFDTATYRAEAGGWNVVGLVNVAAATGLHSVEETLAVEGAAALIGGLPPTGSVAEAVALLDRQAAAPGFRGVRPMGGGEPVPRPEVLRELRDRGLVFELLARPGQLPAAADALAAVDGLTVVVEHLGWPKVDTPEERATAWAGLDALAALGPRVHCKLSGLAGAVGSMDAERFRPWIDHALSAFGPDRCLFASNFPVDGLHGTLDELWSAYAAATAGHDDATVDRLFAANAEHLYRP